MINRLMMMNGKNLSVIRGVFLMLSLLTSMSLPAQKLTVESMRLLANDATAMAFENQRQDLNDDYAGFRMSAEQGYSLGQVNLGYMYEKGYGVSEDYSEALKWYRKAANQGNDIGQNNLGVMYRDGLGVSKDYQRL